MGKIVQHGYINLTRDIIDDVSVGVFQFLRVSFDEGAIITKGEVTLYSESEFDEDTMVIKCEIKTDVGVYPMEIFYSVHQLNGHAAASYNIYDRK